MPNPDYYTVIMRAALRICTDKIITKNRFNNYIKIIKYFRCEFQLLFYLFFFRFLCIKPVKCSILLLFFFSMYLTRNIRYRKRYYEFFVCLFFHLLRRTYHHALITRFDFNFPYLFFPECRLHGLSNS